MKTITVHGYTGAETDDDMVVLYDDKIAEVRRTHAGDPEAGTTEFMTWLDTLYASIGTAAYHNSIAVPLQRYTALRRVVSALIRESDEAYTELEKRTTTAWHAAHHRFVLASCEARARLVELVEAANEVHVAAGAELKYVTRGKYEQMVPAEDRQFDLPDLDAVRAELDEFVETRRERFAITAATLVGTTPAGFEAPEPVSAPDVDRQRERESADW